jgi:hypothetical protein
VDILGGGAIILPPSLGLVRNYEYIQGDIDDLCSLPVMRSVSTANEPPKNAVFKGVRNKALWEYCMRSALWCDDFDALLDAARSQNDNNVPPLQDNEVMKIAKSAWDYTESGRNRFGRTGAWLPTEEVNSLMRENPDALFLLMFLRANNAPKATFMVANGLDDNFGWSRQRLAKARNWLEDNGYLTKVRDASRYQGAALYRWSDPKKREGVY